MLVWLLAMNMLSVYLAEGKSKDFQKHLDRARDYLFLGVEGLLMSVIQKDLLIRYNLLFKKICSIFIYVCMQGYNGSQLWDTAFALQAYHHTGIASEFKETVIKGK